MARPDKAAAVAEIADRFRDSNAAVLTEYRGHQSIRRLINEGYEIVSF